MVRKILVTGGAGLVGSACSQTFAADGYEVVSVDNYARADFFGEEGDTEQNVDKYLGNGQINHRQMDIRDDEIESVVKSVDAVVHTAAQPSHPKSIEIPREDFEVNAQATVDLLEYVRKHNDNAPFVFTSTNKVYGEMPNYFSYHTEGNRFEPDDETLHDGFDETLRVDQNEHTPFGVSKLAADLYVQEYARMYGLNAGSFRMGCITGEASRAVELHNWEPYFMKLALTGETLSIYGYEGYQVRDVLHAEDLANLIKRYVENPRSGEVYNVGGGRKNSVSLLEAINIIEELTGESLSYEYGEQREADHQWWISNLSKVRRHYPDWEIKYNVRNVFKRIYRNLRTKL